MTTEWYRFFWNIYGFTAAGVIPVNKGGTGLDTIGNHQIIIGNTDNVFEPAELRGFGVSVTYDPGYVNISIGASGVTPGTYGSQSAVGQFTINQYGSITFAQNVPIEIAANQITSGQLPIIYGGTGASTAVSARANLSAAILGANNDITSMSAITGGISSPDFIQFDIAPTAIPTAQGALYWDSADSIQTLSLVMEGGNAIQQIGEEQYYRIKCSAAITEGQVVMFTGTVGASGGLTGAPATGLTASTAAYVMGVATESGALNDWIYVTSFGLVRGINTTGGAEAWVDGQILYYDPTVAGGLTKTLPSAPNAKVQVCAVVHAASNGSLFIRSSFGGILGQYEGDVQVTTPANGDLLIRNQTAGKWVNAPLTAGSGVSISNTAGAITISATGSGGTVTSVTGTSPVVSSGGTTPAISLASGYGDTQNPYASKTANYFLAAPNGSAGVPTFRAIVAADIPALSYVTSVSGTGSVNGITLTGTVTSSGSLTLGGTLSGIGNSQLTNSTISGVALGGNLFNLTAGTGVSFSTGTTYNGSTAITINATGLGGTVTSVAALTLGTTGTDLSSTVANSTTTPVITLNVPTASATNRGALSSTDWSTFNNKVTSVSGTAPVVSSGGTTPAISMAKATSLVDGYLSATDWSTFNSKQPAGTYVTSISIASSNGFTGTSSGGATPSLTLATSVTGILKGNGTAISAATSGTDYAPATSGTSILYGNGAGGFSNVTIGSGLSFTGGTLASTSAGGTVTSVAMTVPSFLSISGSPITTSGTLAVTLSGTALPVANGGTGLTSYTTGDLLYASGTTTLSKLADVATGNALISGGVGVAPSWGKIGLTTHISGVLPVANGGTGDSTGPVFFVGRSTDQAISNAIDTVVLFNSITFDITTAYASASGRFQPAVAGYYQINANLLLSGSGISAGSGTILKNGGGFARMGTLFVTFTGLPFALSGSCVVYLNGSTDYVQISAYITAASSNAVLAASTFSGHLIRAG